MPANNSRTSSVRGNIAMSALSLSRPWPVGGFDPMPCRQGHGERTSDRPKATCGQHMCCGEKKRARPHFKQDARPTGSYGPCASVNIGRTAEPRRFATASARLRNKLPGTHHRSHSPNTLPLSRLQYRLTCSRIEKHIKPRANPLN